MYVVCGFDFLFTWGVGFCVWFLCVVLGVSKGVFFGILGVGFSGFWGCGISVIFRFSRSDFGG